MIFSSGGSSSGGSSSSSGGSSSSSSSSVHDEGEGVRGEGEFRCAECYHLFGVDLIADSAGHFHVIEVNVEPDLSLSTEGSSCHATAGCKDGSTAYDHTKLAAAYNMVSGLPPPPVRILSHGLAQVICQPRLPHAACRTLLAHAACRTLLAARCPITC